MVFQGGVFVDTSFTKLGRNGNKMDQLDDEKKRDIENVLNEEFCSLDVKGQANENTCMVQNLEFRVKRGLVVDISLIFLISISLSSALEHNLESLNNCTLFLNC